MNIQDRKYITISLLTSSSAVAKRPRDASCLSVAWCKKSW